MTVTDLIDELVTWPPDSLVWVDGRPVAKVETLFGESDPDMDPGIVEIR